jgi:hypothetical protein
MERKYEFELGAYVERATGALKRGEINDAIDAAERGLELAEANPQFAQRSPLRLVRLSSLLATCSTMPSCTLAGAMRARALVQRINEIMAAAMH